MSFDQPVLLPSSAIPRLRSGKLSPEGGLIRSLEFAAFENALTVPGTLDRPLVSRGARPWRISAWRVLSQTTEVEQAFCRALEAGTHQYVHQIELGVGATTLLQHLVRQFNTTQIRLAAHPMQVCYLSLGRGLSVPSKLLDAIGTTIKFPVSISELRYRSLTRMMEGVCEHLRRTRTVGLIVDHLHRANKAVLGTLVEFAEALDEHRLLQRQTSGEFVDEPLTLLFAGTLSPAVLQSDHAEIWTTIGGRTAQIAPLADPAAVREAAETAFGQREYRWSAKADALFDDTYKETRGLNVHLVSLFQAAAHLLRTETGSSLEGALQMALDEATDGQTLVKSPDEEATAEVSAEKKPRKGNGRPARHRAASDKRDNASAAGKALRQRGFTGRKS